MWLATNAWRGDVGPFRNSGIDHFLNFTGGLNGSGLCRGRHIIWMVVVWVLWMTQNNIIFNEGLVDVVGVLTQWVVFCWVVVIAMVVRTGQGSLTSLTRNWPPPGPDKPQNRPGREPSLKPENWRSTSLPQSRKYIIEALLVFPWDFRYSFAALTTPPHHHVHV